MGHNATELHRYLLSRHGDHIARLPGMGGLSSAGCPPNDNHKNLPRAMHTAHEAYCKLRGVGEAAVLFVVQAGEQNAVDQVPPRRAPLP